MNRERRANTITRALGAGAGRVGVTGPHTSAFLEGLAGARHGVAYGAPPGCDPGEERG